MTNSQPGRIRSFISSALCSMMVVGRSVRSRCRCLLLTWMYPGCRLGKGVCIGAGTHIQATNGGRIELGDHVVIARGVTMVAREGTIEIGAHTYVGQYSTITAHTIVTLGRHCLVAECVTIRDQNHGTNPDAGPFSQQPLASRPISIGDNVWVGAKATVLAGVTIGSDSVLAANAVATRDIPARTVAAGIPASPIRSDGCPDDKAQ